MYQFEFYRFIFISFKWEREAAFIKYLKSPMPCVGILHVLFHKYKTGLLFLILSAKNQRCAGIKKKMLFSKKTGV